jgi:hypothetical protein
MYLKSRTAWLVALIISVCLVGTFFWNEARKEIVFLCGNFKPGTTQESVLRQLKTGELLRYRTKNMQFGKRITVESVYNLYMNRCIIDMDSSGVVMDSYVE